MIRIFYILVMNLHLLHLEDMKTHLQDKHKGLNSAITLLLYLID